MTADLTPQVENALRAFNEYKGMVEGFKTKLDSIAPKMDAFDEKKFHDIQTDIANAMEENQKAKAAQKALEDELNAVKAAVARPAAPGGSKERKEMAREKLNSLFNKFARIQDDENKRYFDSFVKNNVSDENELKALNVNTDANGGYLVTPDFGGVIQTKVYESSPVRQLASVISIGTDSYEVILDNDEASSGWIGETATRSDTNNPTFGKLVIPVNELYASPKATQKILDDSAIDMESWLATKVSDKFARDEATAFISGNGTNKPKGMLSYTNGTDIAAQNIQQVNSGSAGAFTYAGLVDLQNAVKEPYQGNAVFLIQRATNAALMKIVDGQSRPIFNMEFDKNTGIQATIMGKPTYFAADMPTVASAALAAIYGDVRAAYQIVDRMGIRVLRDPYTDKPYIKFYTTKRVGGAVVNFEAIKIQKLS